MKVCPKCSQEEGAVEFGICRSRPDGKNLYCRGCIRARVEVSRALKRAYKAAHKNAAARRIEVGELPLFVAAPGAGADRVKPADRVCLALAKEALPYHALQRAARLPEDVFSLAVAKLLLEDRRIVAEGESGCLVYRLADAPKLQAAPVRKAAKLADGFSRLEALMPGRRKAS